MASDGGDMLTHPDYDTQEVEWEILDAVYRGPIAIREDIHRYLPMTELERRESKRGSTANPTTRDPNSTNTRYTDRAERSILVNGVRRLVRFAMSNLFLSDPIVDKGKIDAVLHPFLKNCDRMGTSFTEFMKQVTAKAYQFGHYFVLIDAPKQMESLGDQRRSGGGPFLVAVSPRDIINWSVSEVNGKFFLDWVVHRVVETRQSGPLGEPQEVTTYRVWYPNHWEVYEIQDSATSAGAKVKLPVLVDEGDHNLGVVPLVGIYAQQLRPMVSDPPLSESAWLNLDHFRMLSAFSNGLHYHLTPILAFSGINDDSEVKVGAGYAVNLPSGAEGNYIEYQGGSMKVAWDAISKLGDEVMEAGLRSSAFLGANTSAEARRLSKSDYNAMLRNLAQSCAHGFGQVLQIAHLWVDREVEADEVQPSFNQDFDVVVLDANLCNFMLNARKMGEIGRRRFFEELKRGEVFGKDVDVDKEIEEAKRDGPAVGEDTAEPDAGSLGSMSA